jgi:hypothetical protein
MAIWTTALLSALAPAAVDAVKGIFGALSRKLGLSVDDEIKLKNADVERLKALAELDRPVGTPSQWVVDLRASFRYIGAAVCVVGGMACLFYTPAMAFAPLGVEIAASAFSFIFGERMYLSLAGKQK